jgi:hypothetical protein
MAVRMVAFAVGSSRVAVATDLVRVRSILGCYAALLAMMGMAGVIVQRLNGGRGQQVADDRQNNRNPLRANHQITL